MPEDGKLGRPVFMSGNRQKTRNLGRLVELGAGAAIRRLV